MRTPTLALAALCRLAAAQNATRRLTVPWSPPTAAASLAERFRTDPRLRTAYRGRSEVTCPRAADFGPRASPAAFPEPPKTGRIAWFMSARRRSVL